MLVMSPRVDSEDLIDAQGVADVLDLSHRNTVSQYQRRYADMPRPVVDLGEGRVKLWLRSDIERWAAEQAARGRTRRRSPRR
jgi:glutathione-regulated potassium-efflux system ancillary protein KefG